MGRILCYGGNEWFQLFPLILRQIRWVCFPCICHEILSFFLAGLFNTSPLFFIGSFPQANTLLGTWPVPHQSHAQIFVVVVGFFLIMLSYGLARGKKHAWHITLVLLLLSAVLHIQRGGSVLATAVALLLAVAMYLLALFFHAKIDPPSARRACIAI